MHDYDQFSGVMFYSQVARNGVACWNTAKPFTEQNHALIVNDNDRMIYPADLNVNYQFTNFFLVNLILLIEFNLGGP